jgi:hypothetical protein
MHSQHNAVYSLALDAGWQVTMRRTPCFTMHGFPLLGSIIIITTILCKHHQVGGPFCTQSPGGVWAGGILQGSLSHR